MADSHLNIFNLKSQKIRMLHLSWMAFFITFVVWFSHAPLIPFIKEAFDLTMPQIKTLLLLNVALTIPARIAIGMLVDEFGPRRSYSALLVCSAFICLAFALSQTYEQLLIFRFLLGLVGAGFVIGIRLVGEWFPAKQVGTAEGIYGGWGNFGSAAAAMTLPSLALLFGGEDGWRYALMIVAAAAFAYGIFFFKTARDTPKGATYFKPQKRGGLEVSSWRDLYFYLFMNIPMYTALLVLVWRLSPANLGLFSDAISYGLAAVLLAIFALQSWKIYHINAEHLRQGVPAIKQYKFKQVAVLNVAYLVTFGSELAVVSMLPLFFMETFSLNAVYAGLLASGFAFMNLIARPSGGWLSDKFGRRKTLSILICGLAVGYLILSQVNSEWWIVLAVLATMLCSFFVQAGEGAVFAMVPLIQRRMTGQIAGMTGAYGNVGAVIFLTVLSFVDASTFFFVIAGVSIIAFWAIQFLDEPSGHMAEVAEDGSVQLIEVS